MLLCLFDPHTDKLILYALCILLCRAGGNLAHGFIYAIHIELFSPAFLVQSYGIANVFCRSFLLLAPILAEVENKYIPLFTLVGINIIAVIASLLIVRKK